MLKDIVNVEVNSGYVLFLRFEDGMSGTVDISKLIDFHGVFEPLKDQAYFQQVKVSAELGTVYWPNGADLDPDVLYSQITNQPIQTEQSAYPAVQ